MAYPAASPAARRLRSPRSPRPSPQPLLRPYVHFLPVKYDFRDLVGVVRWANAHPAEAERIAAAAVDFSRRFLRQAGIQEYILLLLQAYAEKIRFSVVPRDGTYDFQELFARYDAHPHDDSCISGLDLH